ncbi:MAG: hypothetical protein V5A46_10845 [Haloferacaceae archaeon]
MGWQGRLDELLYAGESVRETVDAGTARVVVTSHRVLAFTPELDGKNFRQADRPNVTGVEPGSIGNDGLLYHGIRLGVVGLFLLGTGVAVDFGSIAGAASFGEVDAGQIGIEPLLRTTQLLLAALARLDQFLVVVGVLSLAISLLLGGVYWHGREQTLRISLAGEERDITVPRPEDVEGTVDRLERAIFATEGGGT